MTGCIDNQESWNFQIDLHSSFNSINMGEYVVLWEVSSTNLLSDTTSFSCLNICFS